jgi:hypothetical protein
MAARRRAMEYRSSRSGEPAGGARVGRRPAGRWPLSARTRLWGHRLGDVATGLVAIGGVAIGLFAAGAVAIGLTAVGAVTFGLSWARGRRMGSRRRGTYMPGMGARVVGGRLAGNRLVEMAPQGR